MLTHASPHYTGKEKEKKKSWVNPFVEVVGLKGNFARNIQIRKGTKNSLDRMRIRRYDHTSMLTLHETIKGHWKYLEIMAASV